MTILVVPPDGVFNLAHPAHLKRGLTVAQAISRYLHSARVAISHHHARNQTRRAYNLEGML